MIVCPKSRNNWRASRKIYRTENENAVFAIFRRFSDTYKNNKGTAEELLSLFVGVARLERATACTPCKNASQLHHTPIALAAAKLGMFFELTITLAENFYLCRNKSN